MPSALRAIPLSVFQCQVLVDVTAHAHLGTRLETPDADEVFPLPVALVLQLTEELRPRRRRDVFRKIVVFEHTVHIQVLDDYRLVFTGNPRSDLMDEIDTPVAYLLVLPCNRQSRYLATLAVFLLSRKTSLLYL